MINQRFKKEPKRFPPWLQYMVVHFSGMRYASAHGSWVDPKDLIIRLRILDVERELKALDDAEIEKRCKEKVAVYESTDGTNKPKLALATEKEWKDKILLHLASIKASGPKTRRAGLVALQTDEVNYEIKSLSTEDALTDINGNEKHLPEMGVEGDRQVHTAARDGSLRPGLGKTHARGRGRAQRAGEQRYTGGDECVERITIQLRGANEHGRTLELIVTRAVCNEAAEHCQHIRGQLPPGGLAAKPKWYVTNETENKLPGSYYVRPTSEKDYTQGASILWLRFVNSSTS